MTLFHEETDGPWSVSVSTDVGDIQLLWLIFRLCLFWQWMTRRDRALSKVRRRGGRIFNEINPRDDFFLFHVAATALFPSVRNKTNVPFSRKTKVSFKESGNKWTGKLTEKVTRQRSQGRDKLLRGKAHSYSLRQTLVDVGFPGSTFSFQINFHCFFSVFPKWLCRGRNILFFFF